MLLICFNREALTEMFNQADLDGDGFLSQHEFSLYNLRTSGEPAEDDIWKVVDGEFLESPILLNIVI